MGFNRRTFLQRTAWMAAALGTDGLLAGTLSDRYARALAAPVGRRLALLVGIDRYPAAAIDPTANNPSLKGCGTDVELQRELLIHRFGFNSSDILTLQDDRATRSNIEAAFVDRLIDQAQPGDAVIFHFSGYGSRARLALEPEGPVPLPDAELGGAPSGFAPANTLVVADSRLPDAQHPIADLPEETLWLLLACLRTDRAIAILDTSYGEPNLKTRDRVRPRSRPDAIAGALAPEELAFQAKLRQRVARPGARTGAFVPGRSPLGLRWNAADRDGVAVETAWGDFTAGLFTYTLTQHLWQATPATTIRTSLAATATSVRQMVGNQQRPEFWSARPPADGNRDSDALLGAGTPRQAGTIGADGVLLSVGDDGKSGKAWLGGLPPTVWGHWDSASLLQVDWPEPTEDAKNLPLPLLQVRNRKGLSATVQVVGQRSHGADPEATAEQTGDAAPEETSEAPTPPPVRLVAGLGLREAVRVLPRHLDLEVALSNSLERIERVDATSAFASVANVQVVSGTDRLADCVFGRVPQDVAIAQAPNADLPSLPQSSYGLFSPGQDLLPHTVGEGGEAVKTSVQRLTPQLDRRLALKLLRLTENPGASGLPLQGALELVGDPNLTVLERATRTMPWQASGLSSLWSRVRNGLARATGADSGDRAGADAVAAVEAGGSAPDSRLREASSQDNRGGAAGSPPPVATGGSAIAEIATGSRIRYRLENAGPDPLYALLLGFDGNGRAFALFDGGDCTIPAKSRAFLPAAAGWSLQTPANLVETFLLCSRYPFEMARAALDTVSPNRSGTPGLGALNDPLPVARATLEDLARASQSALAGRSFPSDSLALDADAWATLSFAFRVA